MSLTIVPVGPALDVVATRRGVRKIARRWAAVALAAAALLALGTWRWTVRDHPVQGVSATGVVVDREERVVGWGRTRSGSVTIDVTTNDQTRRATVDLGEHIDQYQLGDPVDVVFNADQPDRVAIAGVPTRSSGVPAAGIFGMGVGLAAVAGVGLRKTWWMRRVVDRYAWVPVTAERHEVAVHLGRRERSNTLLHLHDATGTVIVQRVGNAFMPLELEPVAWVAGLGGSRFVVAPPGGGPIYAVKPVRRAK